MNTKQYKNISYILMGASILSMVLVWLYTDPEESKVFSMIPVGFMLLATMFLVQARIKEGR